MIGGRRAHGGGGERRDRDRDPEPEHDHRRQDVPHVARPGRGKREQGQARTDHQRARTQLQAGADPGGKLPGPAR